MTDEEYQIPEATEEELARAVEYSDSGWGWGETHQQAEALRESIRAEMERGGPLHTEAERWARVLCSLWFEHDRNAWLNLSHDDHVGKREGFLRMGEFFARYNVELIDKREGQHSLLLDKLDEVMRDLEALIGSEEE